MHTDIMELNSTKKIQDLMKLEGLTPHTSISEGFGYMKFELHWKMMLVRTSIHDLHLLTLNGLLRNETQNP